MSAGTGPTLPKGHIPPSKKSPSKKSPSKKSTLAKVAIACVITLAILVAGSNYAHNKALQEKVCQPLLTDMKKMTLIAEQEFAKAEHLGDQMKAYLAAGIVDGPLVDTTRSLHESSMERAKHMLAEYAKAKEKYETTCN